MRGIIGITFAVFISCGLILTAQHSTLAQGKGAEESTRAMVERLEREIQDIRAKIAENPSSPEAEKLRSKMQWNLQRIKAISPDAVKQVERGMKTPEKHSLELEDYLIIAKNNLFKSLGAVDEIKRQDFALTGILGRTAIIQTMSGSQSYYVAEGKSFGNGARLTHIGTDSVTVVYDGEETRLKLGEGTFSGASQRSTGKGSVKQQKNASAVDDRERREMGRGGAGSYEAEKEKEERERKQREQMEQKVSNLYRKRDDIRQKIVYMQERGHVDHDAYKALEEVNRVVQDLESKMR
jgi:hypothetical protein